MRKLKLQIIDWYIIKKFMGHFVFTLAIFIAIAVIFDISEKVDDFIRTNTPLSKIIFDYYLNFIPYYVGLLSPLLIFIAAILFTSRMANNTEIVAILSGGVSFQRLLYPYFVTSLFLSVLSFFFNSFTIPNSNKTRIEFENIYINNRYVYKERNIHMQLDDSTYAYMESYNNQEGVGFKFSLEKFKGKDLTYKLISDQIKWDTSLKSWKIIGYSIKRINGLNETLERGDVTK